MVKETMPNIHTEVYGYRLAYPHSTLKDIGNAVGLTRERIRVILKEANLPTCSVKTIHACPVCGNKVHKGHTHCSRVCLYVTKETRINLVCEECQITFYRVRSQAEAAVKRNYQHTWCCKVCQGRWLGKNFGFKKGWSGGRMKTLAKGGEVQLRKPWFRDRIFSLCF